MSQESTRVQLLRAQYQASLTSKAEQLSQVTDQELPEFLHRLAGSAGMYGYSNIASTARELLTQCAECPTSSMDRSALDKHIEEAKKNLVRLLRDA